MIILFTKDSGGYQFKVEVDSVSYVLAISLASIVLTLVLVICSFGIH